MKSNVVDARRLLIYLHIYFNGNQTLIMKELLEKNLKLKIDDVNAYFKNNKTDESKYITIVDEDYPDNLKDDLTKPILVIER